MINRYFARATTLFAVIFLWKLALLAFWALPVPSNDSFFYDGSVVNFLLHGKYANPSLAVALPISGTEVFSAYPPLYQVVLLGWMSLFGTSVISAMALHLALFGIYMLILLAIFRRLQLPEWAMQVGGLFLLLITFHDRPDSLAHVFGIAAIYAWLRWQLSMRASPEQPRSSAWAWAMAAFGVLSLATGIQIGGLYFMLIWAGMILGSLFEKEKFPYAPMAALVLVPISLVSLVIFGFPHLWAGFLEHAHQTPSVTGWRVPRIDELLKMVRNAPGILAAAVLLPYAFFTLCKRTRAQNPPTSPNPSPDWHPVWRVTLACALAAFAILGASMVILTPNSVAFVGYLQPIIVGGCLTLCAMIFSPKHLRFLVTGFLVLAALGSIRAVGLSTWGIACAADVGYPAAMNRVQTELESCTAGQTVVLSSAYLYQAATHKSIRWIHCDWMGKADRNNPDVDWEGLTTLKPAKLILTQFDYYRRYRPLLQRLKDQPTLANVELANLAKTPPPDSIKSMQKVVQHISWAPIVVTISWK